jgi:hypothetical protein
MQSTLEPDRTRNDHPIITSVIAQQYSSAMFSLRFDYFKKKSSASEKRYLNWFSI